MAPRKRKTMRLSFDELWKAEYDLLAYSCCDADYWYLDEEDKGIEEGGGLSGEFC
ncbi:MAG: hypothetical protein ABWW70_04520 [Thermoproteota archaeon]